jgi:hypothetical protein
MAWIESHQTLAHHPKTLRLASVLKCSVPAAIGHVHLLWYWAMDYAHDGQIDGSMRDQVARACEWRGKPEAFWMGLLQSGFVEATERGVAIHDWMDYAGRLLGKRAANRARSKRAYDAQSTRSQREVYAATVPDRTGPNRTEPDHPPEGPQTDDAQNGATNPRALGTNPRALGTNPRALGTNPRSSAPLEVACCTKFARTGREHLATCPTRVNALS